ncbi:Apoptosis inhibitor 5 [Entophlyctis sp. JEL0112]|nr:Apoptosis inhibitor 5 [Entophlyctis sp. JEL0112]
MPTSPSAQFDAALSLLQHSPSSASATHFKHILHAAAATSPADNSSTANDTLRFRAANAIPKYFHHFPSLYDDALDRHLDLCEDNSPHIRHAAMRSLYLFATPMSDILTAKAVDVLVQLFQTDSAVELTIVKESLDVAVDRHSVVAVETIWDQVKVDHLFEKHFSVDSTSTASDALIRVHLNGLMKFIKLPWARIEHTLAIKDLRKILEKFIAQKSLNGTTKNISKWLSDAIVGFAKADGICVRFVSTSCSRKDYISFIATA